MLGNYKPVIVSIAIIFLFSSCSNLLISRVLNKYNKHNGQEMPEMVLEDVSGKLINTKQFRNKVVLLNTWYTQCSPCISEMPWINSIYNKLLNGTPDILVLNICISSKKEDWKKVVASEKLSGTNLFLPDSLYKQYESAFHLDNEGFPYNIILGKDGKILGGGIDVDPAFQNVWATYMLLEARTGTDAKTSAKKFIYLFKHIEKSKDPEVENFNQFLKTYALNNP